MRSLIKYIIPIIILSSCQGRQSNEMEEMSRDVLKSKQGIEIDFKPIAKEK